MGLVLLIRALLNFQMGIFFASSAELYPVTLRSMALGLGAVFGSFGTFLSQMFMVDASEIGINPFFLLCLVYVLLIVCYVFIPESLGMEAQDPEVQAEKEAKVD